ncbi:MAG: hypothetical protein Tsb0020_10940 [Haliangiales bacterium]
MTRRDLVGALICATTTLISGCAGDYDIELESTGQALEYPGDYPGDDGPSVPDGAQYDRFRDFIESGSSAYGTRGILPPNEELADVYADMTESQRTGLAYWHLFGADRGHFFRQLQLSTWNGGNMLRVVDSRGQADRFERTGLLNDPGCTPQATADEFGLYLDQCEDPYSAGVVGLRLRPNPDFDMDAWQALGDGDVELAAERWTRIPRDRFEWKSDQLEADISVEPPYEVVMTCTVCHAAPNPLDPPEDPNQATWKNIVFALGNQYFQEREVFIDGIPEDDFVHHLLESQHPGTSDTSRMATDHIYNPNTINAIFNLGERPLHPERIAQFDKYGQPVDNPDIKPDTCDGETCEVDTFRVLKDGADSSGVSGAALRVFVNIGSCFEYFAANMDPVWGKRHPTEDDVIQTPVSRRTLVEQCGDYQRLLPRVPELVDYLTFVTPYRLADAPGGEDLVKAWDDPQMALGRRVFAEECATCHSSLQPEFPDGSPNAEEVARQREFATWDRDSQLAWLSDPERVAWFVEQVEDPAFFTDNYLSDDRRYPLSLLGTNSARAMGRNAATGSVWQEYASVDYQTLPPVEIPVFSGKGPAFKRDKTIEGPAGRGYYRTPSLWGIWTSAPLLHNNALGDYSADWSTAGRLSAYQDAMEKLLGLRERPTKYATTPRFSALTTIPLGFDLPPFIPFIDLDKLRLGLPVPTGTPVAIAANLETPILDITSVTLLDVVDIVLNGPEAFMRLVQGSITVFDPVENKGHEFGYDRTDEEKRALIEFLKTL